MQKNDSKINLQGRMFVALAISISLSLFGNSDIFNKIGKVFGYFLIIYSILCLWSWKKENMISNRARFWINTTCWIWFIIALLLLGMNFYKFVQSGVDLNLCLSVLLSVMIAGAVARKYRKLNY